MPVIEIPKQVFEELGDNKYIPAGIESDTDLVRYALGLVKEISRSREQELILIAQTKSDSALISYLKEGNYD